MGYEGFFISDEALLEYEKFDEVVYAGNHGRPLVSYEISIFKVRTIKVVQEKE